MNQKAAELGAVRTATPAPLFRSVAPSFGASTPATMARRAFPQAAAAHRQRSLNPAPVEHRTFRLHDVLEQEAKRMAQSLHDEAGQLLAAVHLKLDELNHKLPEWQRGCVWNLKASLDQMETELRRISHELRPTILDDLGLLPAVEFLRHGVAKRTGLSIFLDGSIPGRLNPTIETALYRIVHEALGNVAAHAGAKWVRITFRKTDRIECTIHDDGIVFDPAGISEQPCGQVPSLSAICERVEDLSGTVSFQSRPGYGTRLVVSIPL